MLQEKGTLRRAGALPALRTLRLGVPLRVLPHARQAAHREREQPR